VQPATERALAQPRELGADRANGEVRGAAGDAGDDRDQPVCGLPTRRGGEQGRVRQPLRPRAAARPVPAGPASSAGVRRAGRRSPPAPPRPRAAPAAAGARPAAIRRVRAAGPPSRRWRGKRQSCGAAGSRARSPGFPPTRPRALRQAACPLSKVTDKRPFRNLSRAEAGPFETRFCGSLKGRGGDQMTTSGPSSAPQSPFSRRRGGG
jgi:hypothetical protein